MEAVDTQIRENNPPITAATYKRLKKAGYSKQEAKEKIGGVLAEHMYYAMHDHKEYDEALYTKDLSKLK